MKGKQSSLTRDNVRSAGLRRWDGKARITTDWINIFHEPELCWPTGDCLVYLREPGQTSRGPAFRIHTAFLRLKGFDALADRCVMRNSVHVGSQCVLPNCPGCDPLVGFQELYIPAPHNAGLEEAFDFHITTRNFFAYLYDRPLAGRTLGCSLFQLKERVDFYRQDSLSQNTLEVIAYAGSQKYLDFRDCVDHALAAVYFAEKVRIDDLWIDAFTHCVGMSHRGLRSSLEYATLNAKTKTLINRSRQEMDHRSDQVNKSVANFFTNEISGSFLGIPQVAREHLERFRLFLKSFYTQQYGCWPPARFEEQVVHQNICSVIFSDFQNLYQYLVDPESSTNLAAYDVTKSGGVCTLQNVQAFDTKYGYEPLAQPLPLIPKLVDSNQTQAAKGQRRMSWNPIQARKANREMRKEQDKQALTTASNHDLAVAECTLVKKYIEFELATIDDALEDLSIVEGRKIRWLLVYAVLQVFHSIPHPPKQVRDTSNLAYSVSCHVVDQMPWKTTSTSSLRTTESGTMLAPDMSYSHTNASSLSLRGRPSKARRRTLPTNLPGALKSSLSIKSRPGSRSSSLRRLMTRKSTHVVDEMPTKRPVFCEIFIAGYGNGLNRVDHGQDHDQELSTSPLDISPSQPVNMPPTQSSPFTRAQQQPQKTILHELATDPPLTANKQQQPPQPQPPQQAIDDTYPPSPPGMTREPSNASTTSNSSSYPQPNRASEHEHDYDPKTPSNGDQACTLHSIPQQPSEPSKGKAIDHCGGGGGGVVTVLDSSEDEDLHFVLPSSVHINAQTWDVVLAQRPQGVVV